MKRTAFCLAVLLLLAGCGAPAPSSQPAPEIQVVEVEPERFFATPYALEDVGYFLDIPEDIGIHDPNDPEEVPLVGTPYQIMNTETGQRYVPASSPNYYTTGIIGGENLYGRMTAIQPVCPYRALTSDTYMTIVVLQAFLNEELETPGVRIPFLQPYVRGNLALRHLYGRDLADVEEFKVYEDDTITVYDFFILSQAPLLEEQLRDNAESLHLDEFGIDYLWLLEVDTYLRDVTQGGVGRFIKPIPAETG